MFSRVSISTRASDLYRGVMRLTATNASAAASKREPDDQPLLAPERAAERSEIEFADRPAIRRPTVRLHARLHDHLTPTRTTRDS